MMVYLLAVDWWLGVDWVAVGAAAAAIAAARIAWNQAGVAEESLATAKSTLLKLDEANALAARNIALQEKLSTLKLNLRLEYWGGGGKGTIRAYIENNSTVPAKLQEWYILFENDVKMTGNPTGDIDKETRMLAGYTRCAMTFGDTKKDEYGGYSTVPIDFQKRGKVLAVIVEANNQPMYFPDDGWLEALNEHREFDNRQK